MLRMSEIVDQDSHAMQHMLCSARVDWEGLSAEVAREANRMLGGKGSALIIDESAFSKKGSASAGVARLWNGRMGKIENSQVGVFSALSRGKQVALLGSRLYLPKAWIEDERRCQRAKIPESAWVVRSKCDLALELVDEACQQGIEFGYVVVDAGYGKDPAFLRGLEDRGLCFVADVHSSQRIYLADPDPQYPPPSGRGRPARKLTAQCSSVKVSDWATSRPPEDWKTVTIREGEKGRIRAEYLHARVWLWDNKEDKARQWHLLVRRECGASEPSHYILSNADPDISLYRLAQMHASRFFIEHAFREAKSELAMADYQVRRWDGWHHHMAMVMIAMLFLVRERQRLKEKAPLLSLSDLVLALRELLPRPEPTPEYIAEIVHHRHRRRKNALESRLNRAVHEI